VISASVKLKAEIVSADEREGGLRRVLNFGHTIGHALESESRYRRFLHGEAVAWGMIAATDISRATGRLNEDTANKIIDAILAFGPLPKVTAKGSGILKFLRNDKKTAGGVVHFVLPTKIGHVEIVKDVPEKAIIDAVNRLESR
jgi:3-dehydroquinate synthase